MKTLVLHSGGLDSTCLLLRMRKYYYGEVGTLSVNYGQRHIRELEAAVNIRQLLGVTNHYAVDLSQLGSLLRGSSQTDLSIPVPEGHYTAESMKATIVPNRNMIMLSVAAAVAIANDYGRIAFAAHSGDHAIYPDCRVGFVYTLQEALDAATGWEEASDFCRISILAPFITMTKAQLLADTYHTQEIRDFPYELTWSCYKGLDVHCGKCGTCVERKEAFQYAKVEDKTVYAD